MNTKTFVDQTRQRGSSSGRRASSPLQWQPVDSATDTAPTPFTFSEQVGPTNQMPDESVPVDFLRLLLNDTLINLLVTETNR